MGGAVIEARGQRATSGSTLDSGPVRRSVTVRSLAFGILAPSFALFACGGGDGGDAAESMIDESAAPAVAEGQAVRDACTLLTGEEVTAILAETVEARPVPEDSGPRQSTCGYYPPGSFGIMYLTVSWRDGLQDWETWQIATSMAGRMWEEVEAVSLDSISGSGPVAGLGDRAYYGGILPSLVLKGDVLLEFKMPLVMNEERNFPLLAKAALGKLD